jgi:nucleoside 2-deoxyribosyltransferase
VPPKTVSVATVVKKPHVFVAMSFDETMNDVYHLGIENAFTSAGFLCYRTDQQAFTGMILHQILTRIESAHMVIGEMTGANPNVYLEMGYALAKGRPSILLAKDGQEVHYDLRSHKCLTYRTILNLRQVLTQELSAGRPSSASSLAHVRRAENMTSEVFVAMPRTEEMEDIFHFGIQQPMANAGFSCRRPEIGAYPADHITKLQDRITSSPLMIAELTGSDPNVYFEIGYAWGRGCPTILVTRDESELHYDVRSHKCLTYKSILGLADCLKRELEGLKAEGILS